MQDFLSLFFYADKLVNSPLAFLQKLGTIWGIRMVCMCSVANFFNLILHLIITGIIIWMMIKYKNLAGDSFLMLLLVGISFSGVSKFLDWIANMKTATGGEVFWSNQLDLIVEGFQFIGIAIILYGILTRLFYIHHAREYTTISATTNN